MTLGSRIKEAADEIGGLTSLGELIDTPRRTVGNWVDGSTEPKASALAEIALKTGVAIKWLVLGIGPKFEEALFGALSQSMAKDRAMEQSFAVADIEVVKRDGSRLLIEVKHAPIESNALVKIHTVVKQAHAVAGIRLQEAEMLRMASAAYNDFISDQVDFADDEEVDARMVLLEKRLVKQLSAARSEPGTGKRSA